MHAVITGATKGIGLAIAEKLANAGYHLSICSRTATDLEQVKKSLEKKHPNITVNTSVVDMRNMDAVKAFGKEVSNIDGGIDVLVNNAGVFIPGMTHEEPSGRLELMMETNLYSAYHLTRTIIPDMKERGRGHVINICSVASQIAYPNGGSYSISKFALLGFGKVLREEVKSHGIKVTNILPGATWSDSWAGVDLPEDRLMQAQDIATTVWSVLQLSPSAVVEEVVVRPQLGDL